MNEVEQKIVTMLKDKRNDFYAHEFFPDENSKVQMVRFENEVIPILDELAVNGEIEILARHPKFENGSQYIDFILIRFID